MAAARTSPPADRVPYAFEKRIMARLAQPHSLDLLGLWARALWRAVVPCVAASVLLGVWSFWEGNNSSAASDFPKEFETAVLIAADQPHDSW